MIDEVDIKRLQSGNAYAQELVYKQMYPEMMKIILRYSVDILEARGIYNSAMLKVFDNSSKFKGDHNSFFYWVRRIVINYCIDTKRHKKAGKIVTINRPSTAHANQNTKEGFSDAVLLALNSLPSTTRLVFNLYVFEGYSHKEIAEKLDITEENSRWHQFSAKKKLKTYLKTKAIS